MLQKLAAREKNIRIVIIGIGSIGNGIVFQTQITNGIDCVAIADIKIEKAIACAEFLQRDYQVVNSVASMHRAISQGKLAVMADGQILAQCEMADALIDCTNAIAEGAVNGITCLNHNKHLIMMNYEVDLTYGPLLLSVAKANNLIYTCCDGDQPAVTKRIIDDMLFWGFDLVMAGNIKGYLDRYVNPTTIIPEADKRNLDYRMCTSYTDGTKLNIEMAVLANALGLETAEPGMIGPRANHVDQVFELYDLDALWKEKRQPLVDYILGARPKGGVFAIGYTENQFQQFTLDWFPPDIGPGPYYLFHRPYHLGHIEALSTVVEAVIDQRALLKPDYGFKTNVISYARKSLNAGESLDGLGGYTCYGLIENQAENDSCPGIPICLAEGVTLKRNVGKDEKINLRDVLYDPLDHKFQLYFQAINEAGMDYTVPAVIVEQPIQTI